MIKRVLVVLAVLGLLVAGYGIGRWYPSDGAVIESNRTTWLSVKQYSPAGKLIGYWRGEYSVETFGGGVIITDEAGEQTIVTGTVKIQKYKKGD